MLAHANCTLINHQILFALSVFLEIWMTQCGLPFLMSMGVIMNHETGFNKFWKRIHNSFTGMWQWILAGSNSNPIILAPSSVHSPSYICDM